MATDTRGKTLNLGGVEYTREQLRSMLREGKRAWREEAQRTPSAVAVQYDRLTKSVSVTLSNQCRLTVPLTLLPELAQATPKQLADVVVEPDGIGIEWPQLDQQFLVSGLLADVCGPALMQELGRRGGKAKSPSKTKAARRNGALGGRPRVRRSKVSGAPA